MRINNNIKRMVVTLWLALALLFVSCNHEESTSKLPEFKIFLNSLTMSSGTGTATSCTVGTSTIGCTLQ